VRWERWRIPIMLAPTVLIITVLFGGALLYGLLQSLGWQPLIGRTELSLQAYANILASERYAEQFWRGLLLTAWISLASTVVSAVLAVAAASAIRGMSWGKRLSVFLLQFNLPVPHIVAAIGVLFLLSQSGLLSRLGTQLGLLQRPADFPILVRDRYGIGIIMAYVWKELPFIGVIVLAVLQSLGENYEDSARTLGANRWQRFRYVTLPLVAPALLSSSMIVFAFVFGAYQIPEILGVRYPRTLSVLSLRFFLDADLNARAEAMAMSVIITAIVTVIVAGYRWVSGRGAYRNG
jgi:putative spermidine/putrescine transport system permease protein